MIAAAAVTGRPGKQEAGAMVVAPEPEAIAVRIDMAMLHCPICFLPLKPPIFQVPCLLLQCLMLHPFLVSWLHSYESFLSLSIDLCSAMLGTWLAATAAARSPAAGATRAKASASASSTPALAPWRPSSRRPRSSAPTRRTAAGATSPTTPSTTTSARARTRRAHARSPAAASPALLEHLAAAHSCHVDKVEYGKALCLRVPASERRRRLLVGEEDKRVFLLAMAAVGAASAVTLVRVAASAETAARYRCKMWANAPAAAAVAGAASGKADMVMVDMEVASSGAAPGGVAVEEATFLAVPPKMLHGEHKEIILGICIDKKTS